MTRIQHLSTRIAIITCLIMPLIIALEQAAERKAKKRPAISTQKPSVLSPEEQDYASTGKLIITIAQARDNGHLSLIDILAILRKHAKDPGDQQTSEDLARPVYKHPESSGPRIRAMWEEVCLTKIKSRTSSPSVETWPSAGSSWR